jgi:hypothetical protein
MLPGRLACFNFFLVKFCFFSSLGKAGHGMLAPANTFGVRPAVAKKL